MRKSGIIGSLLCAIAVSFTGSAIADTQASAVGPRSLAYLVTGRLGQEVLPGSEPVALNGTKLMPGEVGSAPVTQQFIIQNVGTEPITFNTPAVKITGSPAFSITQPAVNGLLPGGATTFDVTFNRSTYGVHVGAVTIESNYITPAPFSFAVEGRTFHAGDPVEFNVVGALPIPDNSPAGVDVPFLVSGLQGNVCTVVFKINGTCPGAPGISHTWMEDLELSLVSPAGTTVPLSADVGGSGDNMCSTVFDDSAPVSIVSGTVPFTGTFRPLAPLYEITGESPNGLWKLNARDDEALLAGSVNDVSLVLRTETSETAATHWELFE